MILPEQDLCGQTRAHRKIANLSGVDGGGLKLTDFTYRQVNQQPSAFQLRRNPPVPRAQPGFVENPTGSEIVFPILGVCDASAENMKLLKSKEYIASNPRFALTTSAKKLTDLTGKT